MHENGDIERDVYYKITNTHDHLHYDSFHPEHVLRNITYNLAKRIIVFVSNTDVMENRLEQLKQWLLKCKYPEYIIDKGIHNARLQGPAPQKARNSITYIHPHMSNLDFKNIVNTASNMLQNANSEEIRKVFKDNRGNTTTE